jgi:hypothetical protein
MTAHDSEPPPAVADARLSCAVDLAERLGRVEDKLDALEAMIGTRPNSRTPDGSGLAGDVSELVRSFGSAPDDSTGALGAGLSRVVAELARADRRGQRKLMASSAAGAAGAMALVEMILQLVEALK